MDCNHARLLLTVGHPLATELETADKQALAAHLADCPECGPWAEAEQRADEKLGAAMRDVPVPEGLQLRIARRLRAERDAWWRGWLVRAAGILLVVGLATSLAYAAWNRLKPAPDTQQVLDRFDKLPYAPEQVEQWYAARNVRMTAPPKFEYGYLKSLGLADFEGKQVPYLLFLYPGKGQDRPGVAQVYVLTDRQFNLSNLRGVPVLPGSQQSVAILPHPTDPQVVYVIVHTAETPLTAFYKDTRGEI
jgi:hypothetical protein